MKQQERVLVYLVTGFLCVILLIAVVFGNEGQRDGQGTPPKNPSMDLAAALDKNKGATPDKPADAGKAGDTNAPVVDPNAATTPLAGNKDTGARTNLPSADQVLPDRPLHVPAPAPAPPATLADKLGPSRIEGFGEQRVRYVRARSGDTLSALVQRWCGSEDRHLDTAKALNEDLATLKVGQEIALPFVADEVVLAAFLARQPQPAVTGAQPAPAVANGAGTPAEAGGTKADDKNANPAAAPAPLPADVRLYEVKAGDMLWKLAVKEVGDKQAPKFIATVKALNPEVTDFDRLKVGQKLKFPKA
ncbi:MAG: LysM peptidoglycan-binding domain-containing protein [Planctomycetes bacterium]|nr:LysM peptidoglycan-binding domain-containing protein [Planctomycetota bacterium]